VIGVDRAPSVTKNVVSPMFMRGVLLYGAEGSKWRCKLGIRANSALEEERLGQDFLSQRRGADHLRALIKFEVNAGAVASRPLPHRARIMEISDQPLDMMIGFSHLEGARRAPPGICWRMGLKKPGFLLLGVRRLDPRNAIVRLPRVP